MIAEAMIDAVYIAVPHYLHQPVATEAFAHGLHVITEKPEAVYTEAARQMNEAYEAAVAAYPGLQYAIMYNQRTNPYYKRIREDCVLRRAGSSAQSGLEYHKLVSDTGVFRFIGMACYLGGGRRGRLDQSECT